MTARSLSSSDEGVVPGVADKAGGSAPVAVMISELEAMEADVTSAEAERLLSLAARIYAARWDAERLDPQALRVNTTEAVVVAAELLRSQQLTPFEFMIWFDRT